jgi:dihydroorotase
MLLMLHYYRQGRIPLETIARKMSHAVADCFSIADRGYIREGYFADLVIADLEAETTVTPGNVLYKCGWSPLEGTTFGAAITHTFVNGTLVYENGRVIDSSNGKRLQFNR